MAAGVVVLLAAAGGAAARVAAVWHRALGAARRQALPCSDLENGAPGVTVGSTSTRGPRALAPAGLRSTSPPAVPQGGARRPPHSLQARAASQSRRSPISSIPLKAASEGESVGGSAGLPAASGIGARARSPHLRADAPASCRVHHGDAPSPVPEAAVLQVHFLDACRMRRAMAVCLATHCAALFSNSYILAGRAVSAHSDASVSDRHRPLAAASFAPSLDRSVPPSAAALFSDLDSDSVTCVHVKRVQSRVLSLIRPSGALCVGSCLVFVSRLLPLVRSPTFCSRPCCFCGLAGWWAQGTSHTPSTISAGEDPLSEQGRLRAGGLGPKDRSQGDTLCRRCSQCWSFLAWLSPMSPARTRRASRKLPPPPSMPFSVLADHSGMRSCQ